MLERVWAGLTLLVAVSGCARPKPATTSETARVLPDSTPTSSAEPRAMPSETVMTGKVVAGGFGTTPTVSLQIEGGKPTILVGPLEPELQRLGGAVVWVAGAPGTGAPNATFTVSRYDIVSIDGAKPAVGTVMSRNGGTLLVTDTDTLTLASAPAALASKAGAKVWVAGRRNGNAMVAQTYGVIRDP